MDTEDKTAWVKSKGIRNQAGNTREVPAYGKYNDMKGLTRKKERNIDSKTSGVLGCQTSSEKQQPNCNFTEKFGLG